MKSSTKHILAYITVSVGMVGMGKLWWDSESKRTTETICKQAASIISPHLTSSLEVNFTKDGISVANFGSAKRTERSFAKVNIKETHGQDISDPVKQDLENILPSQGSPAFSQIPEGCSIFPDGTFSVKKSK